MASPKHEIIYIPLLEEGSPVFRPAEAEMVSKLIYRVLPSKNYDPEDENWAFPPGQIVRCERRVLEGLEVLVAVEEQ